MKSFAGGDLDPVTLLLARVEVHSSEGARARVQGSWAITAGAVAAAPQVSAARAASSARYTYNVQHISHVYIDISDMTPDALNVEIMVVIVVVVHPISYCE